MPRDKRIAALAIMGIIIVFLLILSLIVSLFRHSVAPASLPTPTPVVVTPEPTVSQNIPTVFQSESDSVNQSLRVTPPLMPPQVDDTVGL